MIKIQNVVVGEGWWVLYDTLVASTTTTAASVILSIAD